MVNLLTTDRARLALPGVTTAQLSDANLTLLIAAASAAIEGWLDRPIAAVDLDELVDGTGTNMLTLWGYPILSIAKVATGTQGALRVRYDGSNPFAFVKVTSTGVVLTTAAATTLLFATYPTLTLLAAAIDAVTDWSASVLNSLGADASADLYSIQGSLNAKGLDTDLMTFAAYLNAFIADADGAEIYSEEGFPYGMQNLRIRYRAGFETVPEDIQQAAGEVVAAMYRRSLQDGRIQSERLGEYSYSLATAAMNDGLPASARGILSRYRNQVGALL